MKILRDENTEWDGGDSIATVVAPTPVATVAEPAKENAGDEKADETKPRVVSRLPAPTPSTPEKNHSATKWPMTYVPQPKATHPGHDENLTEKSELSMDEKWLAMFPEPMPTDYKRLISEHRKLTTIFGGMKISKVVRQKLSERWKLVKAALTAMQDTPPAPILTAEHQAQAQLVHSSRPSHRAGQSQQLFDAMEARATNEKYFLEMRITPRPEVEKGVKWLMTLPAIKIGIGRLREELAKFELLRLGYFPFTHTKERIIEIKSEMSNCKDVNRLEELQNEAAQLASPTSAIISRNSRSALAVAWQPIAEETETLLDLALFFLEKAKEDETDNEKFFFESHPLNLSHEQTGASKAFDDIIQKIKDLLNTQPAPAMPNLNGATPNTAESSILQSLFGLDVLE